MPVLVVGELNADLIFSGFHSLPQPGREVLADDFSLDLGGSSGICAAGLARLGTPVAFLGKVGADMLGRFCIAELASAGVDVSLIQTDPLLKTGITASFSAEDRALTTYPGAMTALNTESITPAILSGFTHLHVSSYYLQRGLQAGLPRLFQTAKAMGLTLSLDPGYDPSERWSAAIFDALAGCDVFLLNEVELAALAGTASVDAGLRAVGRGTGLVVVKLGKRGCAAWAEGRLHTAGPIEVDAVDTTGAGDSFNAGFLHAWLRRLPLDACLECGSICGGLSTRRLGGCGGQAVWNEVERRLHDRGAYATILGNDSTNHGE